MSFSISSSVIADAPSAATAAAVMINFFIVSYFVSSYIIVGADLPSPAFTSAVKM